MKLSNIEVLKGLLCSVVLFVAIGGGAARGESANPVYVSYNQKTNFHLYSLDPYEGHNQEYTSQGVAFYTFTDPVQGSVPLYRCRARTIRNVSFVSIERGCEGHDNLGLLGYVYRSQEGYTKPIYRFNNTYNWDIYYATSQQEVSDLQQLPNWRFVFIQAFVLQNEFWLGRNN